ncbi:MAG: hypothetical protein K0Q70_932 [Rhodospirillales bacterium]|jgi:hypothetical protein|nr:hypothetical protein [Rhodospirillales bacterium]
MPDYRLYFRDAKGHINRRVDLEYPDDTTAIAQAHNIKSPHGTELWSGARKVGDIPPCED